MASLKHLNDDISSKSQGTAKVALTSLSFSSSDDSGALDELEKDNVERLVKIFELEGCNRLNPAHAIPGSISEDVFRSSLQHSNLTIEDLRSAHPPTLCLPPGAQICCLQGKHRVAALRASRRFHPWWTVRLYIGLSAEAKRLLAEDSNNEGKRSEGFIFLNILKYPLKSPNSTRWLQRLGSKNKVDVAKRLSSRDNLAGALRIVLEIPGQRKHFKLSVWKRIMTERCDEEIVHYLRLIYNTFLFIMGSDDALRFVDEETVSSFELRAPAVSHQDDLHVSVAMSKNAVLWHVEDESARDQVLQRLRKVDYLIPTIHSLQMDVYYLQQCTTVMRKLILGKARLPVTVQTSAWNAFTLPQGSRFSPESEFLGKLKLLYLDIMQNVAELSGENPLMEDDEGKPEPLQYNENAWVQLAIQAKVKGFDSDEISRLCSVDVERQVASKLLLDARPLSDFDWGQNFDKLVDFQVGILKEARPIQKALGSPELTTTSRPEPVARRCGRQYSRAYAHDRHFCTPHWFTCEIHKGSDVTSLFVRRSVFHAFWGLQDDPQQEIPDDDMADMPDGGEQVLPGSQPGPSVPAAEEDYEMRDAPAFQKPVKRRHPRKTLEEKKTQRDRNIVEKVSDGQTTGSGPPEHGGTGFGVPTADRSSVVTTFISSALEAHTGPEVEEHAIVRQDNRQMTILLRRDGQWVDARRCRRSSIARGIAAVRQENQERRLYLYTGNGSGIPLEDCPTHSEDFICLNTGPEGFPTEEIL